MQRYYAQKGFWGLTTKRKLIISVLSFVYYYLLQL